MSGGQKVDHFDDHFADDQKIDYFDNNNFAG